ncbi:complement factor H-like [Branchiostoma lanceolatum]|uniref:complement factor H-like n=1 Tax=Branchiostoma lanceolatum TaxID=7740 RepID=UPI0034545382
MGVHICLSLTVIVNVIIGVYCALDPVEPPIPPPTGCSTGPPGYLCITTTCRSEGPPYNNGDTCSYTCAPGCTGPISTTVTCNNGIWDGQVPFCERQVFETPPPPVCFAPTNLPCIDVTCNPTTPPYNDGDTCRLVCARGCTGPIGTTWTCTEGGWTGISPHCERVDSQCPLPPTFDCATISGCSAPYFSGDTCTYNCTPPCTGSPNTMTRTCRELEGSYVWDGPGWEGCFRRLHLGCDGLPPTFPCASGTCTGTDHGDVCTYVCDRGCTGSPSTVIWTCTDGAWVGPAWRGCQSIAIQLCPDPPTFDCTTMSGCIAPYTDLETCTYRCNQTCVGSPSTMTRTCRGGQWYGEEWRGCGGCETAPPDYPPCIEVICSSPPPYNYGDTCGYRCARNCTGPISTFVICKNGFWDGRVPRCEPSFCRSPPTFHCATRSGCSAPYTDGETCTYGCNKTCTGSPSIMTRTCTGGEWEGTPWGGCHENCGNPPTFGCTIRTGCSFPYTNGETCTWNCIERYGCTASPPSTTWTCLAGTWVGPRWRGCQRRICRSPPTRYCATYACNPPAAPFYNGATCTYKCRPNCAAIPATTTATCVNGRWRGNARWRCRGVCGEPPDLPCTEREGCAPWYWNGESCSYRCHNEGGYAMEVSGDRIKTCQADGTWSGTDLVCDCKDPEDFCCSADIIFVLDYSGSMFGDIPPVIDFVKELVDRFVIGDTVARVGILRYSSSPMLEFHLNEYDNKAVLLAAIDPLSTIAPGGGTATGAALTYVANTMLLTMNGNRADAPDVVIVLTDGYSADVSGPASVLHGMGVQTFAIGVGSCVNNAQLHDIANCPDHVYTLPDVDRLDGITGSIHKQICCDKPRGIRRYHGCFEDYPARKFPNAAIYNHPAMTGAFCWNHCNNQGFPFAAATQYSNECFCGTEVNFNNLGPQLPDSECDRPCTGNPNEMCGGTWRMSVYSSSDACPANYERLAVNGPCLRFSEDRKSYKRAKQTCEEEGARLVVIKSAAFDAFIDNRIQTTYNDNTWIGLDDLTSVGNHVWIWSDGSVLAAGDYEDWHTPIQPDLPGLEECVEIRPGPAFGFNYDWNNHWCWLRKNYICEKVAVPPCCSRPKSDPGGTIGDAPSDLATSRQSPPVQCVPLAEEGEIDT